jgi:hypothetical protein
MESVLDGKLLVRDRVFLVLGYFPQVQNRHDFQMKRIILYELNSLYAIN